MASSSNIASKSSENNFIKGNEELGYERYAFGFHDHNKN